jgi:hypothetical protein
LVAAAVKAVLLLVLAAADADEEDPGKAVMDPMVMALGSGRVIFSGCRLELAHKKLLRK